MIRLRMLGSVELTSAPGRDIHSVLAQPKRLALLARIAAGSTRGPLRRDTLLALFWPELDEEHARGALNSAVHHLRRSLGAHAILSRGDDLHLNREEVACDTAEFEQALLAGDREGALRLYRGDLLEGWFVNDAPEFEQWLANERARLRALAASAAGALARGAGAEHPGEALLWSRRASALAPDDEGLLRLQMELLDRVGDRAGALRAYDDFARRLEEELGAPPAPETQAVLAAVRARESPAAAPGAPPLPAGTDESFAGLAVETAPLVAAHAPALLEPPVAERPSEPPRPGRGRPRRWVRWTVPALLVLGVGSVAVWRSGYGADAPPARVLVATFDNRTGRAELDPLGAMSADWVAAGVARTELVEVADPTAVGRLVRGRRPAPGGGDDWIAAAASLRAEYLLGGAYYLQGGQIHMHATLYDVRKRHLLAAFDLENGPADTPLSVLGPLQERAMGMMAEALDSRSRVAWAGTLPPPPPYDAYVAYLSGMEDWVRRDPRDALSHFQQALALDSSFATAALRGARASTALGRYGLADTLIGVARRGKDQLTSFQRAELAAMEAFSRHDMEAWLRRVRELSRRAPESEWTFVLANGTLRLGRARESVRVLQSLDPAGPGVSGLYSYWLVLCNGLHATGDYRGELRAARQGLAQYPGNLGVLAFEVRALAALGREGEVRERLREIPEGAWGPGAWTPGEVLAIAAMELEAHGHPESVAGIRARALRWYASLPPERRDPEAEGFGHTWTLYLLRAWPELESRARMLSAREPANLRWRAYLGMTAAVRGDRASASAAQKLLTSASPPVLRAGGMGGPRSFFADQEPSVWAARIAGLLGDPDRALELLEKGARGRHSIDHHIDPAFADLRSRARFQRAVSPRER